VPEEDRDDLCRSWRWRRPNQHRIDHSEEGGFCAKAERERWARSVGKTGVAN
jgi:hypothetical protein